MLRMNPHILPHVVRVSHTMPYQSVLSTWSVCLGIYCPMWSGCLTLCHINPCCPHGQYVSVYIAHVVIVGSAYITHVVGVSRYAISIRAVHMVGMSRYILPHVVSMSRYILSHVVRVSHNMPYQSMLSTICGINPCRPHGQRVSVYIAHVVRVYRNVPYQSVLSTWSACIGIYCPHVVRACHDMPYQSVLSTWSACLGMYCPMWSWWGQHILPMWSVCHNMPYQSVLSTWSACIGIYCPCGQHVSVYIAHVVRMYRYILPPCGQSVS